MNFTAFFLSIISGFGTLIGFFIIYLKCDKNKIIKYSLTLAGLVMIYISIFELIPESIQKFNTFNKNEIFIYVSLSTLSGFLLIILLNKLIKNENDLYRVGVLSLIAIIIHNIPEGIITYISASNNIKLGLKLTLAIMLHNIPEGLTIAIPIYYSTKSKKKAFFYTTFSAFSEPLGAFISYIFLSKIISNFILGLIFSQTAGIMITISITELFPEAKTIN